MTERQALAAQIYGFNSHKHVVHALEGLAPAQAGTRVGQSSHTIFQIVHHMIYWQDISLARLRGQRPVRPARAELGWQTPPAPEDESDWEAGIAQLAEGLRSLEALVLAPSLDLDARAEPDRPVSAREEILMIQGHNSYHLGQIVQLRIELGAWPPPRGGDTW